MKMKSKAEVSRKSIASQVAAILRRAELAEKRARTAFEWSPGTEENEALIAARMDLRIAEAALKAALEEASKQTSALEQRLDVTSAPVGPCMRRWEARGLPGYCVTHLEGENFTVYVSDQFAPSGLRRWGGLYQTAEQGARHYFTRGVTR